MNERDLLANQMKLSFTTKSHIPISKKRKRRNFIILSGEGDSENEEGFAIDEEDFSVIDRFTDLSGRDDIATAARKLVGVCSCNDGYRVRKITLHRKKWESLHPSIGRLEGLVHLDASLNFRLKLIPPSIGKLRQLKHLNLGQAVNLSALPEEIGDLVSLTELNLSYSGIESLPPSIGRLQNLEILILRRSLSLAKLPEEFGNLRSLKDLDVSHTRLEKLPDSFGNLQNLRVLDLRDSYRIELFPDSIGKLQNLEILDADFTPRTKDLQLWLRPNVSMQPTQAFWNLPNLKVLNLCGCGIDILPEYIEKMKGLLQLFIDVDLVPERFVSTIEFQLELASRCRFLGSIIQAKDLSRNWVGFRKGSRFLFYGRKVAKKKVVLDAKQQVLRFAFALALNRARYRIDVEKMSPGLWPYILCNPTHAFKRYRSDECTEPNCWKYHRNLFTLKNNKDALFQLLRQNQHGILI